MKGKKSKNSIKQTHADSWLDVVGAVFASVFVFEVNASGGGVNKQFDFNQ